MPDPFFGLSPQDRRDALLVAASRSGRPAHLLEKDAWVVWTLRALFEAPFAHQIVFKGGKVIDYNDAVRGGLQLVPDGTAEELLAADYAGLVADGLVFESAPDCATLLARCREIQDRANQIRQP